MKLKAGYLLIILIIALLGCSIFTCKMIEGLTGRGGATDVPVDPETLQPLPYTPLASSRPVPNPGMLAAAAGIAPGASIPTADEINAQVPMGSESGIGAMSGFGAPQYAPASSALPTGIPFSDIPDGDEDLYIKKSEIVPPVCPACPTISECPRQKPCPPCPACARCPEPAFECKKVPNYAADAAGAYSAFLPRPVLADFSQFGM